MLKRMGIRKIMVTTTAIFLIGILYLFPVKTPKVEKNITYIDESKFSDVFLLDKNNYLSEVSVVTEGDSLESKLKSKIDSITKKNVSKSNFKPIIPVNTKVISLNVKDNLCTIDFSKEFLSISASLEEKLIEAVVYTLTSESEITEVIIKVEGSILERLPNSNKLLPNKFDRSYGINKEYDINSLYNLTKTTIYYVGEDEGDTYYVPVTKINNDNSEKISIIVNELKSSLLYQSNLGSYLSSKATLEDYKVEEEVMKLTFNDKIFDSMYDKNILEEVVYTIGKSVKENYSVSKVIFYVDDKEVTEF
jgi:spore germination protein gerM